MNYSMSLYGERDSQLIENYFPASISENIFHILKEECKWHIMNHHGGEVPRLVSIQGKINGETLIPIYRHPIDPGTEPELIEMTPTVQKICDYVNQKLNRNFNHVLIQYYRSGMDYISAHSDKTIDISPDSVIVNASFGARRKMILRNKLTRESQKFYLDNNSLFILGLNTNRRWTHEIKQDRRADRDKSQEELNFDGQRISLTFREVKTFYNTKTKELEGQGSHVETMEELLKYFKKENKNYDLSWYEIYGKN